MLPVQDTVGEVSSVCKAQLQVRICSHNLLHGCVLLGMWDLTDALHIYELILHYRVLSLTRA